MSWTALILSFALCAAALAQHEEALPEEVDGVPTFPNGPFERPERLAWLVPCHFPITSSVEEVQAWFDQGHTLLYHGDVEGAARAFRWCTLLDPDCAMGYWGLARATRDNTSRRNGFLRQAVERLDGAGERERRYVQAWADALLPERAGGAVDEARARGEIRVALERIAMDFAWDEEARVLSASMAGDAFVGDAELGDVLTRVPEHAGAQRLRAELWAATDLPTALAAAQAYTWLTRGQGAGEQLMGRLCARAGMWHESAIWMHVATQHEIQQMRDRFLLTSESPTYGAAREGLCYAQQQLGMPTLALAGARELRAASTVPDDAIASRGLRAMVRCLLAYERWDVILERGGVPWLDGPGSTPLRHYAMCIASLGKGDIAAAQDRRRMLAGAIGDDEGGRTMLLEVDGRIALAQGRDVEGFGLLEAAARRQAAAREEMPLGIVYTALGEAYLKAGEPKVAAGCFEESLELRRNDPFALAGLARARYAGGDAEGATEAHARLLHVWSGAEPGLRWLDEVRALGLAAPIDPSTERERDYLSLVAGSLGPVAAQVPMAPALRVVDSSGQAVTLEEYRGKTVVLVFYLGEGCAHCVEQLKTISAWPRTFAGLNTPLLAVSGDSPEANGDSEALGELPFRLLSDVDHENAHRFRAYDDFAGEELHATFIIDASGRVRWATRGKLPFLDVEFLLNEVERVQRADGMKAGGR